MPILSRRTVQRLISENSAFMPLDALSNLVDKLNREDTQSLDALWEVIIFNLLSKIGLVEYEAVHNGSSRPDVYFQNEYVELVADITCISDKDQIKNNDVSYFHRELNRVAKKVGVKDLAGFNLQINGSHVYGKKVKLMIPEKSRIVEFINNKLKKFLIAVAENGNASHSLNVVDEGVDISLTYTPDQKYVITGHPVFTGAATLENNALYNRLNVKRSQLKKSGYDGLKGTFICDGGSDLLNMQVFSHNPNAAQEIIRHFLSKQETISFVFVISVREKAKAPLSNQMVREFVVNAFAKTNCNKQIGDLFFQLKKALHEFPHPKRIAKNAIHMLNAGQSLPGSDFYEGFSVMKENKISVSLKAIMKVIIGEITAEKFLEDHAEAGFILRNKIRSGYRLNDVAINKQVDSDDDWLEFSFDNTIDPASSSYTINK
ncbi:MAG TPA: hypothetical protein VL995_22515 [Cellvibrio sp.]|nr:hypothetical protein [Cellvibrio sp.]